MEKDEFISGLTDFPGEDANEEEKSSFVFAGFSKFFSFGRSSDSVEASQPESNPEDKVETVDSFSTNPEEGRSLPYVLKRISNLIALKEGLTSDKNTNLKQYWMPDSFSNECYDCGEKFTTFRRRHHCRVCGQIFCSRCCSKKIPGKIMGWSGDLRVCIYCFKVVLSYLESVDVSAELSADLKALQDEQIKSGKGIACPMPSCSSSGADRDEHTAKRKVSLGYQEERFVLGKAPSCSVLSDEERCQALQNSASLRNLFEEILDTVTGVPLQVTHHQLRDIPGCLTGSDLVDWLIKNSKAATRVQALAMGQMLLEAGYLVPITEYSFVDSNSAYRVVSNLAPQLTGGRSWSLATDSESERTSEGDDDCGIPQSGSTYQLDMNVEDRTVHVARPSPPPDGQALPSETRATRRKKSSGSIEGETEGNVPLNPPLQTDLNDIVLKNGWHEAANLVRPLYGEAETYHRLSSVFETHKSVLLTQLLRNAGLNQSWAEIIGPIAKLVSEQVRPDYRKQDEMDIRNYVQSKKLPGGDINDIKIISGVVCSKNVAHRGMRTSIENPRILLLQCAIVYQRYEGRVVNLEPVMMQEHEYLRHVVARIAYLKPDVVLVHRNVSRLAQEYLLELGITLVLNVKQSVMQRVARFTSSEIVNSIDAQVGKPQLGYCKTFYLKTFRLPDGSKKTLMFFEGCSDPTLGCTILLRGSDKSELEKIKEILSFLVFMEYNWRFEKSFLMDEFARPPSPPSVLFQDSPTGSPVNKTGKYLSNSQKDSGPNIHLNTQANTDPESIENLTKNPDHKQITNDVQNIPIVLKGDAKHALPISDQSDPLQATWTVPEETVSLAVAELPRGNIFRAALDGIILSISPCLKLAVPYLESEAGRNCTLRSFFPQEMFYSKQFNKEKVEKENKPTNKIEIKVQLPLNILPKHELLTVKFTDDVSNNNVQTLLALYRANGGQIPLGIRKAKAEDKPVEVKSLKRKDVLDAYEHQCFSVLFCSYSSHSENAPAFCVDPWVVKMFCYGPHDISLGSFLETFCFRPLESCPSQTCHVPMQQHSRRFVHDAGAICLTINKVHKKLDPEHIWIWSYCFYCKQASTVVPMSIDTWSLSFAKYLEIRFLGDTYTRRGIESCKHSLHHEHFQFFARDNLVASFKFIPIRVKWEISLPPSVITLFAPNNSYAPSSDELCQLSSKGHEVFSIILEYLTRLDFLTEEEIQSMKQMIVKEQINFKSRIGDVQCRLTSPSLESKKFDPGHVMVEADSGLWKIEDSITLLKRHICGTVTTWNTRFLEHKRKFDRGKRSSDGNVKAQLSPPQSDDGKHKDDDDASVCHTDDEHMSEKLCDSVDVPDSEDNLSITSHPEEHTSEDIIKKSAVNLLDKYDEQHFDSKTDKKSVKTILSHILSSNKDACPIQCPWGPQDHFVLPPGVSANIAVLESEPSSIISYALASHEYQRHMEEKRNTLTIPSSDSSIPSPIHRRKANSTPSSGEKETQIDPVTSLSYCEVSFNDNSANFSCRIYFADEFANLRNFIFPAGEEIYLRSLSRCVQWAARGGKSGSSFSKTKDDRFVIKQMSKLELTLFLEFAPQYLSYVSKCYEQKQPTLLGKIVGVYSLSCRNSSGTTNKSNLLIMENLFYMRDIKHKYDLKGSVRNRLVNPVTCRDSDVVYLDENLLKMTCDSPLYILPHSQTVLMRAIASDTEFLAAQEVMDYSLLVGLEPSSSELVVGIIDYLRTFTWDKRLENLMKTSVIGNQGKQPTIIQPKDYRERFIAAMKRYFLPVPDRWYDFESTEP